MTGEGWGDGKVLTLTGWLFHTLNTLKVLGLYIQMSTLYIYCFSKAFLNGETWDGRGSKSAYGSCRRSGLSF